MLNCQPKRIELEAVGRSLRSLHAVGFTAMPKKQRKRQRRPENVELARWRQLSTRQWMLILAVVCQLTTIAITWRVWLVRDDPVNLPLPGIPGMSAPYSAYLILMPLVISAAAILVWPRPALAAHATIYVFACLLDQYRLQPQYFSLIVLIAACCTQFGPWFARWYLASMWLWTGIHKLLSPDWLGIESWRFLRNVGINAGDSSLSFAIAVGIAEIGTGLLAIFKPRFAVAPCIAIHLAILLTLSPLLANHNESVWPWNLATAVIGAWVLSQSAPSPKPVVRLVVVSLLAIIPAGYYIGLVNSRLSFLLYSGNLPQAIHTSPAETELLGGWTGLKVPFPNSAGTFKQQFELRSAAGDKLHISDPRPWVDDRYFLKDRDGQVQEISRDRFYDERFGEVGGIELDSVNAQWLLARSGAQIGRDDNERIVTLELKGSEIGDRQFALLRRLPNLKMLKIEHTAVTDVGLNALADHRLLEVIEMRGGEFSARGLKTLAELRSLGELRLEGDEFQSRTISGLKDAGQIQTLHLNDTDLDDSGIRTLSTLAGLHWLNVSHTRLTGEGLKHLKELPHLYWLNLSHTPLVSEGLKEVGQLTDLQILELAGTQVDDTSLVELLALTKCELLSLEATQITDESLDTLAKMTWLQTLIVRDTHISEKGLERLRRLLAGTRIDG